MKLNSCCFLQPWPLLLPIFPTLFLPPSIFLPNAGLTARGNINLCSYLHILAKPAGSSSFRRAFAPCLQPPILRKGWWVLVQNGLSGGKFWQRRKAAQLQIPRSFLSAKIISLCVLLLQEQHYYHSLPSAQCSLPILLPPRALHCFSPLFSLF